VTEQIVSLLKYNYVIEVCGKSEGKNFEGKIQACRYIT